LLSNVQFRKNVMCDAMEEFGITLASAATHYNHAFKLLKELNAELVDGLGRPEDKKGGRKPKAKVAAEAVKAILGDVAPVEFIDQQYQECVAAAAGAVGPTEVADQVPNDSDTTAEAAPEKTYTVTRVKDGAVVAEGLTLTDAELLVAKAVAAKKAKLAYA
jgi:hypothetical protein